MTFPSKYLSQNPHRQPQKGLFVYKVGDIMTLFLVAIGFVFGLFVGVYLGAQIIDERNRELKYIRRELEKAAITAKNEDLF